MHNIPLLLITWNLCAATPGTETRWELPVFGAIDGKPSEGEWKPMEGSGPAVAAPERTPDGNPALLFPCDMARVSSRAYWDRPVTANLYRMRQIRFWIKAEGDPGAITGSTIYLNAGSGWYSATFDTDFGGWQRVTIDRDRFTTEGKPQGWNAIRTIRLAFWKGQKGAARVSIGGMEAVGGDVVIVRNVRGGKDVESYADQMADILRRGGITSNIIDDTDVEAGLLEGTKVAVYPHNPRISDKELDRIEAFSRDGGRLLVCYSLPQRLADLLEIEVLGYQAAQYAGHFGKIRFLSGNPAGAPREAKQDSWNIQWVRPAGGGTKVVAQWFDAKDKDTGRPAILVGAAGAYVSHVILNDDLEKKVQLVRAIVGNLDPRIWEKLAREALEGAGRLSRWKRFEESAAGIAESARAAGKEPLVSVDLAEARKAFEDAAASFKAGNHPAVLDLAARARERLIKAFSLSRVSRDGEFRALWCHSAYGVQGMSWDAAIGRLRENGFNAVVPNMLWGGVADYPSEVLPARDRVAKEGDQIALAAAAGKKHGVEVHIWKVNWNLQGAPQDFVGRMRAEKRLQKAAGGAEELWLCPSNTANFELERDSMLEIVRKYDVDGIHFDYIRYPDPTKCFCDGCRAKFEEGTGSKVSAWPKDVLSGGSRQAAYLDFRRSSITRLVETVSAEARRLKPWIKVSAAVFSNWPNCRDEVGQDWAHWVEKGYLDFVCPMNYSSSDEGFRTSIRVQRDAIGGRVPLYSGIGASAPGLPLPQVADQIQIARSEGADGFIIFNYEGAVAADYVPALGSGATKGRTAPPHRAPRIEWRLTQGGGPLEGAAKAGQPLQVTAGIGDLSTRPVKAVEASASIRGLDDETVKELGLVSAGGPPLQASATLEKGLYRLVVAGRATFADGDKEEFIRRGPIVRVEP